MKYEIYIYRKDEDNNSDELFYMNTCDKDKMIDIISRISEVLDEYSGR